MEDLSILDCLNGLNSTVFDKATKLLVVEILANKVADEAEGLAETDTQQLAKYFVKQLFLSESSGEGVIQPRVANLYLGLLSNLTMPEGNSSVFCAQFGLDKEFGAQFTKLIEVYLSFNPQSELEKVEEEKWVELDPFQHVGSILCNLCQVESGRDVILKPSTGHMV
jgi:hypothetical protein